ncbi:MAG: 25S rRNA (adenine645-N1)-methyltransferase [Thelocarpon impressellum]|nr:MAG: 25S rRNA (adenine645-N1)-methyltransferase [Thelocarpon impressellum]
MFAVPGWSVSSAALARQVEDRASGKPEPAKAADGKVARSAKKRKRGPAVTGENLAELWEKVIEGKDGKAKRERKRRKKDQDGDDAGGDAAESGEETRNGVTQSIKERFEKRRESKERKREKKRQLQASGEAPPDRPQYRATKAPSPSKAAAEATRRPASGLTPLQASMRQKLTAARFRHINQTLYTTPSAESVELFQQNPEMFDEYHEGFRRQVELWPENPVAGYVEEVKRRGQMRAGKKSGRSDEGGDDDPLPRTDSTCTIADLGCGDASLARSLGPVKKKLGLKMHSFDLQSRDDRLVTATDMAKLPLPSASVDVAIFCLALMGTNWLDFVDEAFRVLRWKGELWIAEIKSRFGRVERTKKAAVEHSVGKKKKQDKKAAKGADEEDDELALATEVDGAPSSSAGGSTELGPFLAVLAAHGFLPPSSSGAGATDTSNKMFVKLRLYKASTPTRGKQVPASSVAERQERAEGETWATRRKRLKFVDGEGEGGEGGGDEGAVLKPCVYKVR